MKIKLSILLIINVLLQSFSVKAQFVSTPLTGYVEHKEAAVLVEVGSKTKALSVKYWTKGATPKTKKYDGILGQEHNFTKVILEDLDMNADYQYCFVADAKESKINKFKTKEVWEYRKPAPDFSFLTGSCAYFNDSIYDRPGKPYGANPVIFEQMADTPSDFMLWLGDNFYTREADHSSKSGFLYRASHDRATRELQRMLGSRPNYAIWDDHDYGPNDSGKNFRFKDFSRDLFTKMWGNSSYGQKNEGIYTSFLWNDAEFFLMDDRYFRDADDIVELIDGKPNPEKEMYGKQQLDWFKTAIVASPATFKFIVTGSQVLNPNSDKDCLRHFSKEFNEIMAFLELNKVRGVLFLTGDKHHSEIIKIERNGTYPLHDITASPLTSGVSNIMKTAEKDNPARIDGTLVAAQNFAKISIIGPKNKRQVVIDFIDAKGERKGGTTLNESDLK